MYPYDAINTLRGARLARLIQILPRDVFLLLFKDRKAAAVAHGYSRDDVRFPTWPVWLVLRGIPETSLVEKGAFSRKRN